MKTTWQTRKLGDVCEVIGGGTPSKSNAAFYSGNIPWATVRDMKSEIISETEFKISREAVESSATNIIPKNNVIIATRVGLGKVCLLKNDTAINQDLRGVIPKKSDELSVSYLFWWFKNVSEQIVNEGTGATVQGVKLPFIKSLELPLPSFSEQERIAKKLDEVFENIAKAKDDAERNLRNSKELFESYLNSVFAKPGKGWVEKKLGEVCDLKSGTTISKSLEKTSGGILYVKVGDMNFPGNDTFIYSSRRFVNDKDISPNQIVPIGSIIFPKRGGAIFTNKRRRIIKPTIVDLNTMALVPSELIDPDFLYHWFLRIDLTDLNNGSTIPQINNYSFDNVYIFFPKSLSEQKTIVKKLDALSAETKKLEKIYEQKIADLEELKKSILKEAFSGKL